MPLLQQYAPETELDRIQRDLRHSETRFQGLVSTLSEMVWTTEADGSPRNVDSWVAYTGMPHEQVAREGWIAAVHPLDVPVMIATWRDSMATGAPFDILVRFRRHDGMYRWFWSSAVPLRDDDGNIREWIGVAKDVHEQREVEESLRLSNQRRLDVIRLQQEIAQSANDRYAIKRLVAERARDLLGADHVAVETDDVAAPNAANGRIASTLRAPLIISGKVIGALIAMSTREAAFGDDELQLLELLAGILASALANARSQEAKLESERALAFQARLLDSVQQAVMATDPDGRITYWNAYAEKQFGWGAAEVMGRRARDLVVPASFRESANELRRRAESGEHFVADYQLLRRDGTEFTAQVSNTVLRSDDGRIIGFIGVSRDVTKERALEEQLRHAQKLQAVGQLAGGVAHDFNNILTAISGYAELVRAAVNDAKIGDDVDEIRHAARRGADLTRQLLSFSRKQVLQPAQFDAAQTIRAMQNMLRRVLREDITFVVDVSAGPLPMYADMSQLEQVVMNLVVNARDAIEGTGRIVLRAAAGPDGTMTLEVRDTGTGMTDETKARLFEPFFTTKPAGKGTGLGLAVVHGIVQQMQGSIAIDSTPGHGTSFVLTLPLSEERVVAESGARTSAPVTRKSGETVLLVEDNKALLVLCRRVLEREGYTVVCTDTPEVALEEMSGANIDLVITDVVMPAMNGAVLVERLSERGLSAPVIFMSGYTENAAVDQGRARERSVFLPKPFTPVDLTRTVRHMLDTFGRPQAA